MPNIDKEVKTTKFYTSKPTWYAYPEGEQPDVRRSILFKGVMVRIEASRVSVCLSNALQNPDVLARRSGDGRPLHYAIEHSGSDVGSAATMRALFDFVTSSPDRRELLLSQREPRRDMSVRLTKSYGDYFDGLLLGLTATPRDEVDRSTYELFGMEQGEPTDSYEYDEAVTDGYLTPFTVIRDNSKILTEGIDPQQLTPDERRELEAIFEYEKMMAGKRSKNFIAFFKLHL